MKIACCLVMLLIATLPLGAQTVYYRSDWAGIALEPIDRIRIDEFEYVLAVTREPGRTTRVLLRTQKEWKRWVTLFNDRNEKTEESEFENKVLVLQSSFEKRGRVRQEKRYVKGALSERRVFSYSARGIDFVDTFDANDVRLYTDEYEIAASGRLRSMRRVFPDNSVSVLHFTYGDKLLVGEWEYSGGRVLQTVYNERGQVLHREEWEKDLLLGIKDYSYDETTGKLQKETEKNLTDKTSTDRTYDEDGQVSSEKTVTADQRVVEWSYVYDGKKKKSMRRKSDIGVEEWKYYYAASDKLSREEYFRRGFLEMRTVYTDEDSWYEEIVREEQVIIRVYYVKEKKTREEFLQDGKVVRTKDY